MVQWPEGFASCFPVFFGWFRRFFSQLLTTRPFSWTSEEAAKKKWEQRRHIRFWGVKFGNKSSYFHKNFMVHSLFLSTQLGRPSNSRAVEREPRRDRSARPAGLLGPSVDSSSWQPAFCREDFSRHGGTFAATIQVVPSMQLGGRGEGVKSNLCKIAKIHHTQSIFYFQNTREQKPQWQITC